MKQSPTTPSPVDFIGTDAVVEFLGEDAVAAIEELDEELCTRRQGVRDLQRREFSLPAIARLLKVSLATVKRDAAWLRWFNGRFLNQFNPAQYIGETDQFYKNIENTCLTFAEDLRRDEKPNINLALRALQTALMARDNRNKFYLQVGLVKPVEIRIANPDEIKVSEIDDPVELRKAAIAQGKRIEEIRARIVRITGPNPLEGYETEI